MELQRKESQELEELIREMELDLMVVNIQANSGLSIRLERALHILRQVSPSEFSELNALRHELIPLIKGDLIAVPPIAISWVMDHAKPRMRQALGTARDYLELLKKTMSIKE